MKRRQILVAGALAAASTAVFGADIKPVVGGGGRGGAAGGSGSALLPIEVNQRVVGAPISELRLLRFLPGEVSTGVARLDFDVQIFDAANLPRTIYAWQLRRSAAGSVSASNGVRLRFPQGTQMNLAATVLAAAGGAQVYNTTIPNGSLLVLTTARRSTGAPPALLDLRYDPSKQDLYLADRSPRDFDALLLRTS